MRLRRNIDMQYKRLADNKITRKELPGALVKSIKEDWAMANYEQKQEYKKNKKDDKEKKKIRMLSTLEETELQPIDKQKNELKDNPFLYKDFLEFLYKFVERNKENRRVPEILKTLTEGVESFDYIPDRLTTELMISKFFKFRNQG